MNSRPGTIVVAIGGNALAPVGVQPTIHDQFAYTRRSLGAVVALAREGWQIALVHGNGPQVGDALVRNEFARDVVEPLPLGILVASTAGWIGYMIQQSLQNALRAADVVRDVLTVVTQTVVSPDDPRLRKPTKPIGGVLSQREAEVLERRGVIVSQDSRGRWRRLAPSPDPIDVVEARAVKQLIQDGKIVVVAGGGGTPVIKDEDQRLEGIDAVVDKDRVAAILACQLQADALLILTDVEGVYRGWGTDTEELVSDLTVREADALLDGDELGRGSMRPKVEAAVEFVRRSGAQAVIAELDSGLEALQGNKGTMITGDAE